MGSASAFTRVLKPHLSIRTSARLNQIKISPIKEMELLAAELTDTVSLGQGTPSFHTPAHIRDFVIEKVSEGLVDKYSLGPGLLALRHAIALKLQTKNKMTVDPHTNILITVGANEALAISMLALLDYGDEVIVTSPCYSPHLEQIRMAGGTPVFVRLTFDNQWLCEPAEFERAVTPKTKAIVINTPMNPTGTVLSESLLKEVGNIAERHDLFIITDETYEDFIYVDKPHISIASLPGLENRVISVFSCSKSYALTGWRCGYVVATEGIINQLLKLHDAICICAPLPAQYAAIAALSGPQDCIVQFKSELLQRQELVLSRIRELARYRSHRPEGAYYILAKVDGISDSLGYCLNLLHEQKVVLVPGSAFGPTGEGHVRISYCLAESTIQKALDRLVKFESTQKVDPNHKA